MNMPRMRMFAGPNGSGKSTLKSVVPMNLLGVYLNPDEIEADIRRCGFFNPRAYQVDATEAELHAHLMASPLLIQAGMIPALSGLRWDADRLVFGGQLVNAYHASALTGFLRARLLSRRISFSFETVMSSPDKIAVMAEAQRLGFRTYLYYIATDDPQINIARVQTRVAMGGHGVPADKIVSRYHRSLALLPEAIRVSHRAYLFDNSRQGGEKAWIAEVTDGHDLTLRCDELPRWFQHAVWEKIPRGSP